MAQNSKIEWSNHTANLWWGCTEVHAGCDNCYARVLSNRWGNNLWGNDLPRKIIRRTFNDLDKYQKLAAESGNIHRVFIGSMMDIFEKPMPVVDANNKKMFCKAGTDNIDLLVSNTKSFGCSELTTEHLRNQLFIRIIRGCYPNLMLLLLTKRPGNIPKYVPAGWLDNPPPNVMYGYSPVDPASMMNVKALLKVKGKHFLSIEPQLAYINISVLKEWETKENQFIDWIIQGGESGHHKRPFNLEWARSMRDQCKTAGVPYFFKQIDKIQPIPEDLQIRQFP